MPESGYARLITGYQHWLEQRQITKIAIFDTEDHVEVVQKKQLVIEYGILKSMSMF